ncbi:MAG: anti-sigma factor antagonist [Eubacteriales bacterium]
MSQKNATLRISYQDDILLADLIGEMDHHTSRQLREVLDAELHKYRPTTLVLNFEQLTFMDSSGLGFVVGRLQLLGRFGGLLRLVNVGRHIMRIFNLAGLERLPNLHIEGAAV